jgi:hypothetical protein
LTLKCDLYLGGSNPIIALCILSHYGDHLCQVISKNFQRLKVMEQTRKCYGRTDWQTDGGHSYNPLSAMRKVINNVGLVPSEKAIHIKAQDLFIYFWEYLKTKTLSVLFLTSVTKIVQKTTKKISVKILSNIAYFYVTSTLLKASWRLSCFTVEDLNMFPSVHYFIILTLSGHLLRHFRITKSIRKWNLAYSNKENIKQICKIKKSKSYVHPDSNPVLVTFSRGLFHMIYWYLLMMRK